MINKTFYTDRNKVSKIFGGVRPHFPIRPRAIVTKTYPYVLSAGEDMYSLACKLFGETNEHLWTILADVNPLRDPTDWTEGETINIPEVIVSENLDASFKVPVYEARPTTQV